MICRMKVAPILLGQATEHRQKDEIEGEWLEQRKQFRRDLGDELWPSHHAADVMPLSSKACCPVVGCSELHLNLRSWLCFVPIWRRSSQRQMRH